MVEAGSTTEIEQALTASLARRGVRGRVVVRDGVAEFHGAGPAVSIEIGELVQQWSLLPDDMRDGKVEHAVERLRSAIASALPPPVQGTDVSPLVGKLVGVVILAATVLGVGQWLMRSRGRTSSAARVATSEPRGAASGTAVEELANTRARESCEGTRRRLYAGATSLDVDPAGWVIELWLARDSSASPLAAEPALAQANDATLATRLGAVAPAHAEWVETGEPARARLRFDGGYLHPFMRAEGRDRFVALVDQLTEATRADQAALFARCEHLTVRDIGAYFRGRDAAGAAAALLFAQGLFSEPPIIDKAKLGTESGALGALLLRTSGLETAVLEDLIRDNGGRLVASEPGAALGSVGLTFALGGPTRAQQAARALAKQRKLQ